MPSRILHIENLRIGTKSEDFVDGLSFSIDQGEIVALTGKSGSGKTSVALAILNSLPPGLYLKSGSIQFLGLDGTIHQLPEETLNWHLHKGKNIGFIQQDVFGAFDPVIKMGKQMALIIHERTSTNKIEITHLLESALQDLGIDDADRILNSYPHQLSGGQLQRCLLGMTLAMKPSLIIADEPTSAVDKIHQQELFESLKWIRDKYGIAILCITHDRSVVQHLADREIQMDKNHSPNIRQIRSNEKTSSSSQSVIELKEVAYLHKFGGIVKHKGAHIRNISFQIDHGECLGILGESGSGKSTMAQLLVGLLIPDTGQVVLHGRSIDFNNKDDIQFLRSNVQLVMQDGRGSLHPNKSISFLLREVLNDAMTPEEKDAMIESALTEVGLPLNVLYRAPSQLSGGECFRVSIARALLKQPGLLICDESTAALDTQTRDEVLKLLSTLSVERGLSLILISHDETVITSLADHIMVVSEGEIVELGDKFQMISHPVHPLTKRMLSSS